MIKSTDEDEEAITGLLDTDAKTNSESNGSSGASDSNNEGHTSNHNIADIPLCGILSVNSETVPGMPGVSALAAKYST